MESLCPPGCDRASEVSICLEDDTSPEAFLNTEEVEELAQSLKDALEDEEVKPKLQCLMSNPDFSMVTVQCEDSGIHWETTSSRCSTPWASEASTTSDVYSMESSSAGTLPGKVIFIMDEGKLRRKKVRPSSSGKFSRLSSHHKKSGDNPKPSADSVGESFKQALEKAKRHLSTHTEEVSTTDSSAKCPEEHTVQHSKVPNLDVSTENTTQEEKMNPVKAEATAIPPDNQEEQAKCTNAGRKEPENIEKDPALKHDSATSASCPVKDLQEKKTTTTNANVINAKKYKGRNPQSLVEKKAEIVSSQHDIEKYPPYVLEDLSNVLENIAKLCNPRKDGLSQVNEIPSTQSNVFSIVSDGSEILNILAPDLISTVDQDASEEMQDRLEYLEENPMLMRKQLLDEDDTQLVTIPDELDQKDSKTVEEENVTITPPDKSAHDIDYFEKFTLIDTKIPIDTELKTLSQEPDIGHDTRIENGLSVERKPSPEEDYYMLHNLDESFYGVSFENLSHHGAGPPSNLDEDKCNQDKEVKKTNGATLFNPDEGVLTKSFLFPTSYPINPELLEEPPALSFLYTDLYEEARGSKTKHEHDRSDAESTTSLESFHSRISDDDGTGIYFEKFNLKDEIPAGADQSDEEEFYSDEGSEEEQYLSYEVLPKENLESETRKDKENTPSAFSKIPTKETPTRELPVSLQHEIDSTNLLQESVNNRENVDTIKIEAPKPNITKQKCIADEEEVDETLDYVIISPDDLEEDDVSLKEITFEDQESLECGSDLFLDSVQEATQEQENSGFVVIDQEMPQDDLSKEVSETSLEEDKKAQIDTFCNTCEIPIVAIDNVFGDHKNHDVTTLENSVNSMTSNLEKLLEKLQESSLKTEEFVPRVEALFNEVEKNCTEGEKSLAEQNEKMIEKVIAQHKEKRESFQEVKKMKMDYLYDQMVSFQQNVDTAKEVLEKAAKDLDELDAIAFLVAHNDINGRLITAIENTLSLEKMPSAFSFFDHLSANAAEGGQKGVKHVSVPQTPKLKTQEANSATSTSITVYWTLSEEDIIDYFQVYCMEEPQGNRDDNGLLEEYRVTVKESFCILEDLEPDKCYSVWVMAVNNTGCSLPSDKSIFKTAPSTPVIKAEECTVCWNTAVIRWSTAHPESTDTFTLEWCKQYSSEGEGLRSVSGIKDQQLRVSLQPGENYFFYVKAANAFGCSEQSEAALISTKGTRFHLLRDTAHPALDLSPDGTVIGIAEEIEIAGIPLVLGELLPASGRHYWEMMVTECSAYSVGATFHPSPEEDASAQDSTSWCMQCSCSSTSFSYKFLHNEVWSEVHLTEPPVRVGVLLDYRKGRLSFYNVQKGQLLFTFRHRFTEAAHPTFALEAPGEIHLHTGIELPHFAKHS
ncbi:cardiomyopathy-associated protein 5 isoform X1 [Aquarana catesbeiana]|uniref:cardiomyopathy-associated protein 5 isoform X1 n=1 Tax=Aquarana catesbeiana TaxID=8400 RepID=UPI003CC95D1A